MWALGLRGLELGGIRMVPLKPQLCSHMHPSPTLFLLRQSQVFRGLGYKGLGFRIPGV